MTVISAAEEGAVVTAAWSAALDTSDDIKKDSNESNVLWSIIDANWFQRWCSYSGFRYPNNVHDKRHHPQHQDDRHDRDINPIGPPPSLRPGPIDNSQITDNVLSTKAYPILAANIIEHVDYECIPVSVADLLYEYYPSVNNTYRFDRRGNIMTTTQQEQPPYQISPTNTKLNIDLYPVPLICISLTLSPYYPSSSSSSSLFCHQQIISVSSHHTLQHILDQLLLSSLSLNDPDHNHLTTGTATTTTTIASITTHMQGDNDVQVR